MVHVLHHAKVLKTINSMGKKLTSLCDIRGRSILVGLKKKKKKKNPYLPTQILKTMQTEKKIFFFGQNRLVNDIWYVRA
jgi:hypothetical protein